MSRGEPATEDVKVRPSTKKRLERLKRYRRETFDEVITRLLDCYEKYIEQCEGGGHG